MRTNVTTLVVLILVFSASSTAVAAEKPDYGKYSQETLAVVASNMHDQIEQLQAELATLKQQIAELRQERRNADAIDDASPAPGPAEPAAGASSAEREQAEVDRARWDQEWQAKADAIEAEIANLRTKATRETDKTKMVQIRADISEKQRELAAWGKEKKSFIGSIESAMHSRGKLGTYAVTKVVDKQTLIIQERNLPVKVGRTGVMYHGTRNWVVRGINTEHVATGYNDILDGKTMKVVDSQRYLNQIRYVLEVVE